MRALLCVGLVIASGCKRGVDPAACELPDPQLLGLPVDQALAGLDGLDFDAFVDESHEQLLLRSPELITDLDLADTLGVRQDQLDDLDPAFVADSDRLEAGVLERLRAFDRESLSSQQKVSYDVYEWLLDDGVRYAAVRQYDYPITPTLRSVQANVPLLLRDVHPLETVENAEDYVARLGALGRKVDQTLDRLDASVAAGLTPPRSLLDWSLPRIDQLAAATGRSSELYVALEERIEGVDGLSSSDRSRLLDEAETAVDCHVAPSFQRLADGVRDALGSAPSGAGVGLYPGGDAFYDWALRHHTSTEQSADEIHQLGLDELDRIHAEMRQHFDALGYPRGETLSQLYQRVATDGGAVPEGQVVATYEALIADAIADLGPAFHEGPPTDVIVIGGSSGGFYVSGTPDGSRPGAFYARVAGPEPRFAMATLAYHEAVPGHHLQISLAQQLDRPLMRSSAFFTAYIEGWALYAEWLAAELGWYEGDPYGDLGRLQFEAFRAARLVVDTGLHDRGWTFAEATNVFQEAVGWPRSSSEGQIARYMSWPAQATAYKIGQLRLLELRSRAETELDTAFDQRDFHSVVLDEGAVPLDVLETVVDDWIAASR